MHSRACQCVAGLDVGEYSLQKSLPRYLVRIPPGDAFCGRHQLYYGKQEAEVAGSGTVCNSNRDRGGLCRLLVAFVTTVLRQRWERVFQTYSLDDPEALLEPYTDSLKDDVEIL